MFCQGDIVIIPVPFTDNVGYKLYQLYFKVSLSETLKLQWLMPICN